MHSDKFGHFTKNHAHVLTHGSQNFTVVAVAIGLLYKFSVEMQPLFPVPYFTLKELGNCHLYDSEFYSGFPHHPFSLAEQC